MNHHKVESGVVDVRCSGRSEAKPSGLRRRLIISNKEGEGNGLVLHCLLEIENGMSGVEGDRWWGWRCEGGDECFGGRWVV